MKKPQALVTSGNVFNLIGITKKAITAKTPELLEEFEKDLAVSTKTCNYEEMVAMLSKYTNFKVIVDGKPIICNNADILAKI